MAIHVEAIEVNKDLAETILESRMRSAKYFRLRNPMRCSFEYSRKAHSSSFARVAFFCRPNDRLLLEVREACWPAGLGAGYVKRLNASVLEAIATLIWRGFYPFRAVSLVLEEVGWDDVRSSEVAIFKAAMGALEILVDTGDWELVS